MFRVALGVEYDGSPFNGWQVQKEGNSIQANLESALSKVADTPISVCCAGRTDAGVHAMEQVIHFDTPHSRDAHSWVFGTNTHLIEGIRVNWAHNVPNTFNARRSALRRHYRYILLNRQVKPGLLRQYRGWYYKTLAIDRMQEGANYWLGEQDFSAFRGAGCQSRSPVRTLHNLQVARYGDHVVIDVIANAFLYHMVRNMVGVLMAIGDGRHSPKWAKEVLESRDRRCAGVTAPASGLYLVSIRYPKHFGLPQQPEQRLITEEGLL